MNAGCSITCWSLRLHDINHLFFLDGLIIFRSSRLRQMQVQVLVCLHLWVGGGVFWFQKQVHGINDLSNFILSHLRCRNSINFLLVVFYLLDMQLILYLNSPALHCMVIFFVFVSVG